MKSMSTRKVLSIVLSLLIAVQTPAMAGELVLDEEIAVSETQTVEDTTAQEVISTEETSSDVAIEEEVPGEVIFEEEVPVEAAEEVVIPEEVAETIPEEETVDGELLDEEPVEESLIPEDIFEEELEEEPIETITEELPAEEIEAVPSEGEEIIEEDEISLAGEISALSGNIKSTIPTGAIEYNGHFYYCFPAGTSDTYENARTYCENLGGYLATISSSDENSFLYNYITGMGIYNAYFGYFMREDTDEWGWCNSEKSTYVNWASGEPNHENRYERYAMFYWKFTSGKWNDGDFGRNTVGDSPAFICEWEQSENASFNFPADTWWFGNYSSKIPVGIYRMFFDDATAKSLQKDDNGSGGHCAGMVTSASSAYKGFPSTLWGNKAELNNVNKSDYSSVTGCTAIDFIDYAYTYQYTSEFQDQKIYHNYTEENGERQRIDELRDAVYAFQVGSGDPVYIAIGVTVKKDGKELRYGHAIMGYKIEEETEDYTKIAVYDCNRPNQESFLFLNGKRGNYDGWSYSYPSDSVAWNSDMYKSRLSYVVQTQDFINDYSSSYSQKYTLLKMGKTLIGLISLWGSPYLGLEILNSDIQDIIPITRENGADIGSNNSYWLKNDGPVSFTNLTGDGDISLAAGQLEMTADPAEGSDLSINLSKGEAIFSNCEGDNISVKYELSSDYENSTVTTIKGISDGESITTQDASGNVIFTGLEKCNIRLDANKENSDGTTTTTGLDGKVLSGLDPSKEYIVYEIDKKELEVYEDKDGNGSFETPVTARKLFKDVTNPADFFYDPVYWAVDNGITTGYSDNTFRPNNLCHRAAVVTFLWRMAGKPDEGISTAFSDMTGNEDFDRAITWASNHGITTGYDDGTFRPYNPCHRAAIVTFIWRYAGKPEPSSAAGFSDMTKNVEFDKAIAWAAENNITTGYNDGTFRPYNSCLRLAVVTFLYRYAHL